MASTPAIAIGDDTRAAYAAVYQADDEQELRERAKVFVDLAARDCIRHALGPVEQLLPWILFTEALARRFA